MTIKDLLNKYEARIKHETNVYKDTQPPIEGDNNEMVEVIDFGEDAESAYKWINSNEFYDYLLMGLGNNIHQE